MKEWIIIVVPTLNLLAFIGAAYKVITRVELMLTRSEESLAKLAEEQEQQKLAIARLQTVCQYNHPGTQPTPRLQAAGPSSGM